MGGDQSEGQGSKANEVQKVEVSVKSSEGTIKVPREDDIEAYAKWEDDDGYELNIFHRRYRMQPWVFDRMMRDVANYDPYFVQTRDACGRLSLSTEQKLTCAMRMLAYGIIADFCDDYLDIAKTTAIEIFEHFTKAIWNVYHETYLRRPTPADLRRLLDKAAEQGFPRMVGSLDCMHWQWKNCLTGWAG
ncbi:uncharacterized protein LOC112178372 [Rosa chinensis]|uniref:uncharacterized protein LOC112178372 n=1 Tax=Rosa chinensis TaxID=74649 RepID=UPI001AD8C158|nr:uncharacterized protein LOC112178372 [Rosa chinensis]